ncbi:MAG: hypothetical protein RL154_137 [Pseudomonadota bacterium]
MIVNQAEWTKNSGWQECDLNDADLVFIFGYGDYFNSPKCYEDVKANFPKANIVGCSTSGNILCASISDEAVALSAVSFQDSKCELIYEDFADISESFSVGEKLAKRLSSKDLKHILVLSDGLNINGDKLVEGLNSGACVAISGGLAGDSTSFANTFVVANEPAKQKRVAAVGFYGDKICVNVGCRSGWDEFGPERVITKSLNNVLFEIDGKPALELYKSYLGEEANALPGSGLKFPIAIRKENESETVIRTLLAVDENEHSLTFAGNVDEGMICKLMKANLDKLIDNSEVAANDAVANEDGQSLSVAVSCVGRRLVLGQHVEDELEVIKDAYGKSSSITGFYSYGEIAPQIGLKNCKLHNQTMTITTISENA